MNIEIVSAVISSILIIVSYIPYLRGILRGNLRPNIMTWLSWTITSLAYGIIIWFAGGGWVAVPISLLIIIVSEEITKSKGAKEMTTLTYEKLFDKMIVQHPVLAYASAGLLFGGSNESIY
jgi:hypothetical protein